MAEAANLGVLSSGRDNNLNLLRILAATAVLISHSFVLATGNSEMEPLRNWLGMSLGELAVCIFFVVSGFLVTGSICKSQSAVDFAVARSLRIFPGLFGLLLLTVFFVGPIATTAPLEEYFGLESITYLVKCGTLIGGISSKLPGVFEANPYKGAVNGSLWTLTWEVRCYVALALCWLFASVMGKFRGRIFFVLTIGMALIPYSVWLIMTELSSHITQSLLSVTMFAIGTLIWQLRKRIVLSTSGALSAIALLVLAYFISFNGFRAMFPFALAYIVMYFAFVPSGIVRYYNRLGDYSYGLYLYAFLIQQLLAMAWKDISIAQMIATSLPCSFLASVVSWHFIEKFPLRRKALALKRMGTF